MPRGEPQARGGSGPGLAIGAVFAVFAMGATALVLRAQHGCGGGGGATPSPPGEPFSGARAALAGLGSRACAANGTTPATTPAGAHPTAAPPPGAGDAEALLGARGYVATTDGWTAPEMLPRTFAPRRLEGSCGVVGIVADGGAITRVEVSGRPGFLPCGNQTALVAVCGTETLAVLGTGTARARTFALPGLTPDLMEDSGLDAELLLAHAEAERWLRSLGWLPQDEVFVQRVAATTPSSTQTLAPPAPVKAGCVAWIGASEGLGLASTFFGAIPLGNDPAPDQATFAIVSCAPGGARPGSSTSARVVDRRGDGGKIAWRAYAPRTGPTVPSLVGHGAPALTVGALHRVDADQLTLPQGVPLGPRTAPEP